MPTVVTFWRLPEEEPEFIEFLSSTGDVVWLPWQKVPDRSMLVPRPLDTLTTQDPDSVLLGLRDTLGEIPINTFAEGSRQSFAIVATEVPMLIYQRGKWRGQKKLGSSNLSGEWTVVTRDNRRIDQPDKFVKWGKKVMQWVRKRTPLWHQYERYRITPKVAEAIKNGLELEP
jgi:hypothetical protein